MLNHLLDQGDGQCQQNVRPTPFHATKLKWFLGDCHVLMWLNYAEAIPIPIIRLSVRMSAVRPEHRDSATPFYCRDCPFPISLPFLSRISGRQAEEKEWRLLSLEATPTVAMAAIADWGPLALPLALPLCSLYIPFRLPLPLHLLLLLSCK